MLRSYYSLKVEQGQSTLIDHMERGMCFFSPATSFIQIFKNAMHSVVAFVTSRRLVLLTGTGIHDSESFFFCNKSDNSPLSAFSTFIAY